MRSGGCSDSITDISIPWETELKLLGSGSTTPHCAYSFIITHSEHARPLQNANTFSLCQG